MILWFAVLAGAAAPDMVVVGPGDYLPLFPPSEEERSIAVPAFALDILPVTNGDFLLFVLEESRWRRDEIPPLFYSDGHYLGHWEAADRLGSADPDQPVTQISWFAARAYCEAREKRLPTEVEWELAAAATAEDPYAPRDTAQNQQILEWYGRPSSAPIPRVGSRPRNYWGVQDLHGVVWEWVDDFNGQLINVDNRQDGGTDNLLFCGSAAYEAADKSDYAAFMRVGLRSSLEANFSTKNLGFRCAADLDVP